MWAPEGGYSAIKSILTTRAKLGLFAVLPIDPREVQALDKFIALKEQQINRLIHINENLNAMLETEWLRDYILMFPNQGRSGASMPRFGPRRQVPTIEQIQGGAQASMEPGMANEQRESHVDSLAHLLESVQSRGYLVSARAHHLGQAGLTCHERPHVCG